MCRSIIGSFLLFILPLVAFSQDFFHKDSITIVKVYFEEPHWQDILDSLKEGGEEDRLQGKAYVNSQLFEEVAVRYKGNSSFHGAEKRGEIKLPLNIKFHKDNKLPEGYDRLKLANGFRDPSFIREVLSYEIAGKYLHAPKANFAKVFVNDQYLGLYTSAEDVDKVFLKEHFGYHKGVMFKCDPIWNTQRPAHCPEGDKASLMYLGQDSLCYQGLYELKSDHGWAELIRLTELLNSATGEELEQVLNIDQTLWLLAFNNVFVNLDSYIGAFSHNYYLYQDSFGLFHPIIWDLNLSMGGFTLLTEKEILKTEDLQEFSLFTGFNDEKRPLVSKLLKNDLYRKIYIAHVKTLLEENFLDSSIYVRIDTLRAFVDPYVTEDANKLYSYEDFVQNFDTTVLANGSPIIGLKELFGKRIDYLKEHPLLQRASPSITLVDHKKAEDKVRIIVDVEAADRVWLCYRAGTHYNFRRIPMLKEEHHAAHEAQWIAELPAEEILEYYIIAEGEKAAALAPPRASKEFFTVSEKKEISAEK